MQVRRIKSVSLATLVAAILVITWQSGSKGEDIPILEAQSKSGSSATLVVYSDGLFGCSADLILRSFGGQSVRRISLVKNRDHIEDVRLEFESMEFKGEVIYLHAKGNYYKGPVEFSTSQ